MANNGYYILITENNGLYYFQLWYRGKQAMGNSKGYKTKNECKEGLNQFKKFLISDNIIESDKFAKVSKLGIRQYIYQFYDENGNIIYTSRILEDSKNCLKSMKSTCKNLVDAKIK